MKIRIEKHGINFEQAKIVFQDPNLLNYEDKMTVLSMEKLEKFRLVKCL